MDVYTGLCIHCYYFSAEELIKLCAPFSWFFFCYHNKRKPTIFQLTSRIIVFCMNQQQKEYLCILSFAINQVIKTTAYQVQTLFFLFSLYFLQVQMPSEDLLSHQSIQIAIVMCILFCFLFGIGKGVTENTVLWLIGKIINWNGRLKEDHFFQRKHRKYPFLRIVLQTDSFH